MYFLKLKNKFLGKIYIKKKDVYFKYSSEEQWTGEYWLDGKKIYTKTIYEKIGSPNDNNTINIAHGISDIGDYKTLDFSNSYWIANNEMWMFNSAEQNQYMRFIRINSTYVSIQPSTAWSGYYGYITLRYTKTTN